MPTPKKAKQQHISRVGASQSANDNRVAHGDLCMETAMKLTVVGSRQCCR